MWQRSIVATVAALVMIGAGGDCGGDDHDRQSDSEIRCTHRGNVPCTVCISSAGPSAYPECTHCVRDEGISRDLVCWQPFRARWQCPRRRGLVSARIHQEKYQNIVAAAAAMALAAVAAAVLQRSQRPEQLLVPAARAATLAGNESNHPVCHRSAPEMGGLQ